MVVDMVDYVESLKREVQPPGSDIFAAVTEAEWVGYLGDAFWEARLDGFLEGWRAVEEAGDVTVESVRPDGPDIPRQQIALVILYAGIRVLRNRILNMPTTFRAKAGPVEFEQQNSATMLAEMLKQLKATKDHILQAIGNENATAVTVLDAYSTRIFELPSYFGSNELAG